MAERGVDDSRDNPFSFKTFVNVKDKKTTTVTNDRSIFSDDVGDNMDNIFATVDRNSSKSEKPKHDNKATKKTKQKENPFSFKKFLAGSPAPNNNSAKNNEGSVAPLCPPDVASDIPSLHHDYFSKEVQASKTSPPDFSDNSLSLFSGSAKDKKKDSRDIPDVTSNSNKESSTRVPANGSAGQLSIFNDHDDDDDLANRGTTKGQGSDVDQASGILQLPDFLSDGHLHSTKHDSHNIQHEKDKRDEDLLGQIRILQDENNQLHKEVSNLKQKCTEKNQRLGQLKNDMERLKKKEAEETAVMEKAVLQVEENLVTTTKRAVQAESTITKLKQEVKSLQNQVRSLTVENESFKQGDGGLSDIRERTKYTSDQLVAAAGMAEKNLKELLSGVDQLKLLSQVMGSWEKITDASPDQEKPHCSEEKQSSPSS